MPRSLIDGQVLGARETERALKQLPKATAKGVLRRALVKSVKPTVEAAKRNAPKDDGDLADSIKATTRLSPRQRKGRNRGFRGAVAYVGPTTPKGAHGHFVEFGTSSQSARPFLRRAWSATRGQVLGNLGDEIWSALAKSARTLARKAVKGKLSKTAKKALR